MDMDLRTTDITLHGQNLRTTDKYICLRTCNICNGTVHTRTWWNQCVGRIGGHVTWGMDYVHGVNSMEKDVKGGFRVGQDMDSWKRVGMEWMEKDWTWEDGIRFQFSYFLYCLYSFCFIVFYFPTFVSSLWCHDSWRYPLQVLWHQKNCLRGCFVWTRAWARRICGSLVRIMAWEEAGGLGGPVRGLLGGLMSI